MAGSRKIASRHAIIAHGGAGGRAPAEERAGRRRGLLKAVERGAEILRGGGAALEAVIAAVTILEDDPLFNAGYGSVLTLDGKVEMDAAVMTAEHRPRGAEGDGGSRKASRVDIRAGGVTLITRVRNPILLARVVMEQTSHFLIGGAGAERLARQYGLKMCRPDQLQSQRARQRWLAVMEGRASAAQERHGTVGAVAVDSHGRLAAATSTGGISGKLPGRIGDSAIIGAGVYANAGGAASATGTGEAIMRSGLCRIAVDLTYRVGPRESAVHAIGVTREETGGEAGIIIVDPRGRVGYAHNANAMEVAIYEPVGGLRHLLPEPVGHRGG